MPCGPAVRQQAEEILMRLSTALVAVGLVVSAFTARPSAQARSAGPSVAGEILVKFRPGVAATAKADAHRLAGGTRRNEIVRTGIQLVAVPSADPSAAIARYQRNPNVLYAEPNFIRSVPAPSSHTPGSEVVPGDYYFREQWALHNSGQEFYCIPWIFGDLCLYVGTPDADIDAPEAWAMSTGSPAVIVAVIDTGIDYTHPDLAANYAGGYNFAAGDANPMDDHGHGTHVSGTIAAALDNLTGDPAAAEGVVGIAPNARILGYKVCAADGTCSDFAIEQAVARAITDGAKVINMSLGSAEYSQSLDDAVQDAWNAGLVIVAAAGNNGTTDPFYPAALDNVISVGAFDEDDRRAAFSNYGTKVDISAPGNVIMSTYPLIACPASELPGNSGCYTWQSGTSMAAPHVAGAAALVWSRTDVTTNRQVVDILLRSADPQGVASERLDAWTVHGGLNLHDALSYGLTNQHPVANAGADQAVTDNLGDGTELVTLDGSASADAEGSIVSYQWREGTMVIGSGATPAVWLSVGVHTLTLDVTDNEGDSGSDTVMVTVNALNRAPVASNTSASTVAGTPVTVTLFGADVETCELAFSVVQAPASGALGAIVQQACAAGMPNTDTARVTYTPGDTAGTYTFGYKANDGSADSDIATVTITVTAPAPPPAAVLTVTGVNPNAVSQFAGRTTLVISGTGFADGASVTFANGSGPAPRVLGVTRNSSTQLTVNVEIPSGGPRKNRVWDVRVTNPDGATAVGVRLLTVTP
jgi:thermitase